MKLNSGTLNGIWILKSGIQDGDWDLNQSNPKWNWVLNFRIGESPNETFEDESGFWKPRLNLKLRRNRIFEIQNQSQNFDFEFENQDLMKNKGWTLI